MKKHPFLFAMLLLISLATKAQEIIVSPTSLLDFSYIENEGPSEEDTLFVSASGLINMFNLTDIVLITANEHFEVSTQSGTGFGEVIRLIADTAGIVEETTIYVRMMEGLPAGLYDDDILISSQFGLAPAVIVHCSGEVIPIPTLPVPVFSPEEGIYAGEQQVEITCDVEDATILYRFNPNEEWMNYISPLLVDRDMTICAKATKEGYYDSEEVCADYSILYTITATANPEYGGEVEIIGGGTYHYYDTATLTATPNEGYVFSSWSNGETDNPMEVIVTGDATYQANFEAINYQITVIVNPEYGGEVSGGGTYHYNDTATLTATPNEGYLFSSWSNGEIANPMEIIVTDNATYQANFEAISYQITVIADPEFGGEVSGGGTFYFPNLSTVTAVPHEDYAFVNWTENDIIVSEEAEYTINDWSSHDLVAHFKLTALPNIMGGITAPNPICAGNSLHLNVPEVSLADTEGWQMSPDSTFEVFSTYTDQILDEAYNNWWLRYMASNEVGTTYSDHVAITVYPIVETDSIVAIEGKKCGDKIEHILVYPKAGYCYQWYLDDVALADTTQYIHNENGLQSGIYRVEIGLSRDTEGQIRCPMSSPEYEVKWLGKSVYPNPSRSQSILYVENDSDEDAILTVFSSDGKTIFRQYLGTGQNILGINLQRGIYMFSIADSKNIRTEKVIIQ